MITQRTIDLVTHLLHQLGHNTFLSNQLDIILSIISPRDVLGNLGTHAGKSVCFQIPALIFDGLTLVITPTISLMNDQVSKFNSKIPGKTAAYINSTLSHREIRSVLKRVRAGSIRLLYVSPERLDNDAFTSTMEDVKISLLVIDEAHCVIHDGTYRPDYFMIGHFANQFHVSRIAAFSATVPNGFATDTISNLLELRDPQIFRGSLNRKNLYYDVQTFQDNGDRMTGLRNTIIELFPQGYDRGIIFCGMEKDISGIRDLLSSIGISSAEYHGKFRSKQEREKNLQLFLSGKVPVLVATKAFEVGVDIPDIRFVICFNVPSSLSNLLQQWGRAGRDGLPAYCALFYAGQDWLLQDMFLDENIRILEKHRRGLPKSIRRKFSVSKYGNHFENDRDEIFRFVWNTTHCRRKSLLASQNRILKRHHKFCCDVCEKHKNNGTNVGW